MTDWSAVDALRPRRVDALFAADPDRVARFCVDIAGLHLDLSRTHLDADALAALAGVARSAGVAATRDALFAGAARAAHTAERGEGHPDAVARAGALHARMRGLIDAIEADVLGPVRHILHIGIGAAGLGPKLLVDALGREADRYDVAVVSNIDGLALEDAVAGFDPAATLIAVASASFATPATLLIADSALAWLAEHGVDDPYGRVIALTAAPDAAIAWGIDETRILPFGNDVAESHAIWSSVGFCAAIALGWDAFEELLEGAAEMDRHFRLTAAHENAPMLAAFADTYHARVRACPMRATFVQDERLRLLPAYLQQLDGTSVVWGGVGTDAQAVVRSLERGTAFVPAEFVAVKEGGDALDEAHHSGALMSAFLHGAALMAGDRPSATILLDRLDARTLGALIAFYEHRAFAAATLLGLDPFAPPDAAPDADALDASTRDLIARAFGD